METVPALFRSRSFSRWFIAGVLGRLTFALAPIAMLVAGSAVYGSVATGARMAAVVSVAGAVAAPIQGRRLDRRGVAAGLRSALWSGAVVSAAMAAAAYWELGSPAIEVLAGAWGISLAVVPAGFRALLTQVVDDGDLNRASHIDAVGFEIALIGAPLVAAVAATLPAATMFLVGAGLAGTAALCVPVPTVPLTRTYSSRRFRFPAPRIMTAALAIGVSGGLLEPSIFARVEEIGRSESLAALLLAVIGIGSALGGVWTSLRTPRADPRSAAVLLAVHGAGLMAAAFAGGSWLLAASLLVAGVPLAPLTAVGATLLDQRVPHAQRSAAFALAGSAMTLGAGIGQALAGVAIAQNATTVGFLSSVGIILATAAVATKGWARRRPADPRE